MKEITVDDETIQEAKNILDGVYAPLTGFVQEGDFYAILDSMRLLSGEVWSLPIVLDISSDDLNTVANEKEFAIKGKNGQRYIIQNPKVYTPDKQYAAKKIFGTDSGDHPGVERFMKTKEFFVGGHIRKVGSKTSSTGEKVYPSTPQETKIIFSHNNWVNVVAFQTRNPPHRSHEFLQKHALNRVDGLLIHPVVGPKKRGDVRDEYIMRSYEILCEKYYPKDKVVLGTFHTFMRYVGPREAVFHALVRRNFGCTHMIIGRDHAGVSGYYDSYAAHTVFNQFTEKELGICVLKYQNVSYCKSCRAMRFEGECPCGEADKLNISGTRLREMIKNKEDIPENFMRREVSDYLKDCEDIFF